MPENPIISAKKTDEYFIAIAQQGKHRCVSHTFLLLGVVVEGEYKILARLGKQRRIDSKLTATQEMYGFLFNQVNTTIRNEKIFKNEAHTVAINYSAYSITYEQFLNFFIFLKTLNLLQANASTEQDALSECVELFQPQAASDYNCSVDNDIKFTYSVLQTEECLLPMNFKEESLYKKTQFFNYKNSCRHTAVDLLNYVRDTNNTPLHVSSSFYTPLPIPSELKAGGIDKNKPFYILPLPPTAYIQNQNTSLEAKKFDFAVRLYRLMENMILIEPNAVTTYKKFNKLKSLYNQHMLSNYVTEADIVRSIIDWHKANQDINVLRKTYFFDGILNFFGFKRKSATERMLNSWVAANGVRL